MFNSDDILQLPSKLTQNGINYIAKQLQTIYDAYFGSDEDNEAEPLVLPFIFNGSGVWSENINFFPNSPRNSYHGTFIYDIHINGEEPPETYISTPVFQADYSNSQNNLSDAEEQRGVDYFSTVGDYYTIAEGTNYRKPISIPYRVDYGTNLSYYNSQYNSFDANNLYSITTVASFNGQPFTKINIRPETSGRGSYYNRDSLLYLNYFKDKQFFTTGGNSSFVDNTYNSNTYVTNEGDSITYYYNDWSVVLPVGVGTGGNIGVGGAGVALSYNDFKLVFDSLLDDLNIIGDDGNTLSFPSYTDIKYGDMGDFYIEPIHQYDKLPVAPQIDYDIDFAEYPAILAETATAFFNMLPVTLSALLAATLVIAALIRNIGR